MIITGIEKDPEILEMKARLLGSLLLFIQTFFKIRTGRDFSLSHPEGRESHHITICRELTKVFYLETNRLLINVPPGHYKSTILQHFVAWAWAHYPDCQFIYLSYSHDEAAKNTGVIKSIMELKLYKDLFGVHIHPNFSAKDDFKTTAGGTIRAFGSSGSVTGKDAGFANCDRFPGGLIMDDMHKPDEVYSDTIREGVIDNYYDTIAQRVRGPKVPRIFLGQCLHEGDLALHFRSGKEGYDWKQVVLEGLDGAGNALDPAVITAKDLLIKRDLRPDVFYAQYQQDPRPPGGGIFKQDRFVLLDEEPNFLATFITADTAETDKDYNDPTVFSFWGLYKLNDFGTQELDVFALHWLDCLEDWFEPKDLRGEFMDFYASCCRHKMPPRFAAIEKKSTGVTLLSVLSDIRGLEVKGVERTKASGSKTARFFEIQETVNKKLISLPRDGKHTEKVITHCKKITSNNTHAHDDIADTLYDAVKIALINKSLQFTLSDNKPSKIATALIQNNNRIDQLRQRAYGR